MIGIFFWFSWAQSWVVNAYVCYFCCGMLLCAEHLYGSCMLEITYEAGVVVSMLLCSLVFSHEVLTKYPVKFHLVVLFSGQVSADPFHLGCTVWYCSTARSFIMAHSVKVQDGVFLMIEQWWLLASSPCISGAVIRRCWLQFYIQFIGLLVAYSSLLAAEVLCLTPYALPNFLKCCSVGCANPLYQVILTPTACLLFCALAAPHIQWLLLCLCFACWISMSSLHLHAGLVCLASWPVIGCGWLVHIQGHLL